MGDTWCLLTFTLQFEDSDNIVPRIIIYTDRNLYGGQRISPPRFFREAVDGHPSDLLLTTILSLDQAALLTYQDDADHFATRVV